MSSPTFPAFIMSVLKDDIKSMDLTIIVENQGNVEEIKMIRSVMAASSPIFKTMLEGNFKEGKSNKIEFSGVLPETVKRFILYCFTGTMMHIESNVLAQNADEVADLLNFLRQYQINMYLNALENKISPLINFTNVVPLYDAIVKYGCSPTIEKAAETKILEGLTIKINKQGTDPDGIKRMGDKLIHCDDRLNARILKLQLV